jgi:hypothetical protein
MSSWPTISKVPKPHTFESLLQIKGFEGLDAPQKQFLRHDAQWTTDPLSSAQFVTDCDWYSAQAPAVARFQERWGPGEDNEGSRSIGNEEGRVEARCPYALAASSQQIMVGTAPEQHDVEKRLYYTVRGDGKVLAEGKFGAWILGQADIDVPWTGVKQLELETRTELSKKPTLFWANARIVTGLPVQTTNILPTSQPGKDYFGGPVKIVGMEYDRSTAAQPKDETKPGLIDVNLDGTDAVRFKATLGSDYPPGPEEQRRKIYAVRAPVGTEARFLTLIEPYQDKPVVKSAVALSADELRVELLDGRTQDITIGNFTGTGKDIAVQIQESKPGAPVRQESSNQP